MAGPLPFLLALLGYSASGVLAQNSTTAVAETTQRIIGGTATTIANYPYLVSIETYEGPIIGWDPDCGGSILSPTLILTAAHCVYQNQRPGSYRVRAGSTTRGSGGVVRRLRGISMHPNYNWDTDDYDVGVLTLATPLAFSDVVKPVSIVARGSRARPGQHVFIAGWGVINTTTEEVPSRLMHTSLRVTSNEVCRERYRNTVSTITSRMVCAHTAERDSCQGDSGGPMVDVNSHVQSGIVSFGYGCAEPGFPGVYTDLANEEINSYVRAFLTGGQSSNATTPTTSTPSRPPSATATPSRPPAATATPSRPPAASATTSRPPAARPQTPRPPTSTSTSRPTGSTSRPTLRPQPRPNAGPRPTTGRPCRPSRLRGCLFRVHNYRGRPYRGRQVPAGRPQQGRRNASSTP